jgi:ubiquinone/menaquinone biosynthesis C-methylase UbiE
MVPEHRKWARWRENRMKAARRAAILSLVPTDAYVQSHYDSYDEQARLFKPGEGDLTRLRTWELFARYLPPGARVADVGGGPGTHAAHLMAAGHDLVLIDPVSRHVAAARAKGVRAEVGDARELPLPAASVDAVLLMGPLYHLIDPADRRQALAEARRVLRPGGVLLAEMITRHSWTMDAIRRGLDEPRVWAEFDSIQRIGTAAEPAQREPGGFFAYFHRPEELRDELAAAGFPAAELLAVEGFAHLLPGLAARMREPQAILRAVRLTENDPSMLGASLHVVGVARSAENTR